MPPEPYQPSRVTLFYGHIASNLGDQAINLGTVRLLRRLLPGGKIEIILLNAHKSTFLEDGLRPFRDDPDISIHHVGIQNDRADIYLERPLRFFADCGIAPPECVLLASGEHLFDYGDGENARNLFWRLLPAWAAMQLGCPVVQLPATFGPLAGPGTAGLIRDLLPAMQGFAARDERSRALLCGELARDAIPLLPDPAFFLPGRADLRPKPEPLGPRYTGLVIRSDGWGIRLSGEARQRQTARFRADGFRGSEALAIALHLAREALAEPDMMLRLFVQTTADAELSRELIAQLPDPARVEISRPATVEDYIADLAGLERLFTSRFHAAILGWISGVAVYAFHHGAHGHKMPGLYQALGWPEACANANELTPAAVCDRFTRARQTENGRARRVFEKLAPWCAELEDWLRPRLTARPAPLPDPEMRIRVAMALQGQAWQAHPDTRFADLTRPEADFLAELCRPARIILEHGGSLACRMAAPMPGKLLFCIERDPGRIRPLRAEMARLRPPSPIIVHPAEGDPARAGRDHPWFRNPDLTVCAGPDRGACLLEALRHAVAGPDGPARALTIDPVSDLVAAAGPGLRPGPSLGRLSAFDLHPEALSPEDMAFLSARFGFMPTAGNDDMTA